MSFHYVFMFILTVQNQSREDITIISVQIQSNPIIPTCHYEFITECSYSPFKAVNIQTRFPSDNHNQYLGNKVIPPMNINQPSQ